MDLEWDKDVEKKDPTARERKLRWIAENPDAYKAMREREKERKKERRRAGEKVDAPYKPVSELTEEQREKRNAAARERMRRYRERKSAQNALPQAHASKYPDQSIGYTEAVLEAHADRTGVVNLHGQDVDFNTAWGCTDADLRAQVYTQLPSSATEQELLDAYCALHYNRYGEEFDF